MYQSPEVRELRRELQTFIDKGDKLTRSDCKRMDAIMASLASLKRAAETDSAVQRARVDNISTQLAAEESRQQDAHVKFFRAFMAGAKDDELEREFRSNNDLLAGTATISFTAGPQGGVSVPTAFQNAVELGLAQTDPLLDPDVCNVIQSKDFSLRPYQIPGWDLSTISAVKVTESDQHASDVVPQVDQKMVNGYTYRLSLGASLEFEQDVFDSTMARMGQAYGIGFARGIGVDLIKGDGSTAPQGVLTGAHDSGITTANSGKLVLDDFTSIFFAVNRIYRANPKCAWLMSDAAYRQAREATDNNGRPLLDLIADRETILGKPVYVCPSLDNGASVGGGHIVFGDLAYFNVRLSTMLIRRRLQVPGYVEYGKALYTGLMRADAVVNDPTNGAMSPIVSATVHA